MLYIHNRTRMAPGGRRAQSPVLVDGARIARVDGDTLPATPAQAEIVDAGGCVLAPGLIDLQLNGGFGFDFTSDPESIWTVAGRLPRYGVTSFLPTIVTSPMEAAACAQEVLRRGPPAGFRGAWPIGLHLEGPFLNPDKRGAHNPLHLRQPDLAAIAGWSAREGVRLVTLAPELSSAHELIRCLRERGVVVSAGHSMATYEQAAAALEAGVAYGTHLFNAMPPLDHRRPGLAALLLADPRAVVGLIADGVHLHPGLVNLVWRAKGAPGINLVTDAMAALGMPAGRYKIGDFEAVVDADSARLPDGRLAGSVLSLDQALRNLIRFTGCSLGDALTTVTRVPARLLGLTDHGEIAPGLLADLVLLTPDGEVRMTIARGEVVYRA
jgi:N-acetylglucosamine-6-phosphate deacetylase